MKFRLTYEGGLRPTQRDQEQGQSNPLAPHKHAIRREFHKQLKQLWKTNRFLREYKTSPRSFDSIANPDHAADRRNAQWEPSDSEKMPLYEVVARRHNRFGYRFALLAPRYFDLLCSIHVLFLRHDTPGSVIQSGDIDNRLKTLIDTLRLPQDQHELIEEDKEPREGEDPFFCLLQDDNQVSGLAVETDSLLEPLAKPEDKRNVKVIVTVELRPYYSNTFNIGFL